jgi:hypothetical protein
MLLLVTVNVTGIVKELDPEVTVTLMGPYVPFTSPEELHCIVSDAGELAETDVLLVETLSHCGVNVGTLAVNVRGVVLLVDRETFCDGVVVLELVSVTDVGLAEIAPLEFVLPEELTENEAVIPATAAGAVAVSTIVVVVSTGFLTNCRVT